MSLGQYCAYCRGWRDPQGFKKVTVPGHSAVRHMCPKCQEVRQKPPAEREALAKKERDERKKK